MMRIIFTFALGILLGIFGAGGYHYWHLSHYAHTLCINQAREQALQALATYIHTTPDSAHQTAMLNKLAAYTLWYETPKTLWKAREDVMRFPQAERTYIETIHKIAQTNNLLIKPKKPGLPPALTPEAIVFFEEIVRITSIFITMQSH